MPSHHHHLHHHHNGTLPTTASFAHDGGHGTVQASSHLPSIGHHSSPLATIVQSVLQHAMTATMHPDATAATGGGEHHGHGGGNEHMSHATSQMDAAGGMIHGAGNHGGMDAAVGGHSMGHNQYFSFSTNSIILFKPWETSDTGSLIGSMIAVFFMAVIFEGIRTGREIMAYRATRRAVQSSGKQVARNAALPGRWSLMDTLAQTLAHMLFFTWSYFLMLIFMTFNAWLCISVILGIGTGYLIFIRFRPVFSNQQGTEQGLYHPAEDECCV